MDKSQPSNLSAFLAYLLPIIGWLYVLVARRNDDLALHHTRQAITLVLAAIVTFVIWAVFAWLITWVRYLGPVLAVASFGLVIATYAVLGVLWLIGVASALRSGMKPLPITGRWADRLPI